MNDVVDEIVHLPFATKKRIELGKHLGIPSKTLRMMELKGIENYSHSKKPVLTEMIEFWFERDKSASLVAMMDILENKMGMRLDEYEDRVTKGVVSQLGSCVEETDIEQIVTELKTYLPELIAGLVTENSTDDDRTKMRRFLETWTQLKKYLLKLVAGLVTENSTDDDDDEMSRFLVTWIDSNKEDATWSALIGRIGKINKKAASKIETMRCPAKVEQSLAEVHVEDQAQSLAEVEDQARSLAEVEDQAQSTDEVEDQAQSTDEAEEEQSRLGVIELHELSTAVTTVIMAYIIVMHDNIIYCSKSLGCTGAL